VRVISIAVFIAVMLVSPFVARASSLSPEDEVMLNSHMGMLNFGGIDAVISGGGMSPTQGLGVGEITLMLIRGEYDLSPRSAINTITDLFFGEVRALTAMMRHMIVIAVLSAFFRAFTLSFKNAGAAELGFYINYLAIIAVLLSSFAVCVNIMYGMVTVICELMLAVQPVVASLAVMSGAATAGYVFSPVIVFFTAFIANIMRMAVIPVIVSAALMQIISFAAKRDMLQKLSDLLRNIVTIGLRTTAGMFITILALQRFSAPMMNSAVTRGSKFMLNLVPVVGGSLTGAVDAVLYWAGAVKGGVMAAVIIVIILMCLVPILQLGAFTFIYKLTAALVQPICDERIVKAIDAAGTFAGLMLSVCVLLGFTFVFAVIIVLSL
jgi:stage III sporulation protein AE